MARIVILGTGAVGTVASRVLAMETATADELVLADADPSRLRQATVGCSETGREVQVEVLDVADQRALDKALDGASLVLNLLPPELNRTVMEAALRGSCNYLDTASGTIRGEHLDRSVQAQLGQHDRWVEAGLTALLHAGTSPGITNLLARDGVDRFDRATAVRIRSCSVVRSRRRVSAWSPATGLRDHAACPLVVRRGRLQEVDPFEGDEEYDFPELGLQTVVDHVHEEVSTLARAIPGLEEVDFKYGDPSIHDLRVLHRFGLLSEAPVSVGGCRVAPLDVVIALTPPTPSPEEMASMLADGTIEDARSVRVIEVEGERGGARARMRYVLLSPSLREASGRIPGANHISYGTGVAVAAFSLALLDGTVRATGVFPPESLEPGARARVLDTVRRYGMEIEVNGPSE